VHSDAAIDGDEALVRLGVAAAAASLRCGTRRLRLGESDGISVAR